MLKPKDISTTWFRILTLFRTLANQPGVIPDRIQNQASRRYCRRAIVSSDGVAVFLLLVNLRLRGHKPVPKYAIVREFVERDHPRKKGAEPGGKAAEERLGEWKRTYDRIPSTLDRFSEIGLFSDSIGPTAPEEMEASDHMVELFQRHLAPRFEIEVRRLLTPTIVDEVLKVLVDNELIEGAAALKTTKEIVLQRLKPPALEGET